MASATSYPTLLEFSEELASKLCDEYFRSDHISEP